MPDDKNFIQRINSFLSNDKSIEVVGEAYNGRNVIKLCKELHPDLVVMDIRMPVMDGVQASKEITDKFPDIKIINCVCLPVPVNNGSWQARASGQGLFKGRTSPERVSVR